MTLCKSWLFKQITNQKYFHLFTSQKQEKMEYDALRCHLLLRHTKISDELLVFNDAHCRHLMLSILYWRPSGIRANDSVMYISLAIILKKRLNIYLFMRQLLSKLEHSQVQDGRIGRSSRSQTCVVSVSRNSPPFHTCSHSGSFPPSQVSPVWMIKYSSTETLEYRLLWSSTPSTPASLWPTKTASGQGRRTHTEPGKHQQL